MDRQSKSWVQGWFPEGRNKPVCTARSFSQFWEYQRCRCRISGHNTAHRCSANFPWLSNSRLTLMISSMLPNKSTERAKLRAPMMNSWWMELIFPSFPSETPIWFLENREWPNRIDAVIITTRLSSCDSSGHFVLDVPSDETMVIECTDLLSVQCCWRNPWQTRVLPAWFWWRDGHFRMCSK